MNKESNYVQIVLSWISLRQKNKKIKQNKTEQNKTHTHTHTSLFPVACA